MKRVLVYAVGAGVTVGCGFAGREIAIEAQLPIFDSLRDTASIIFGIMGIWIAVLFPDVLQSLFSAQKSSPAQDKLGTMRRLIAPMLISTIVLIIVMAVHLADPILRLRSWTGNQLEILRATSFATLGLLTFLQFVAVLQTLIPQDIIFRRVAAQERRAKVVQGQLR
jgi:hypothetical protein